MAKKVIDNQYNDYSSERVVISYAIQQGSAAYADINTYIKKEDFSSERNQAIFSCIGHILNDNDLKTITVDAILSAAKDLGIENLISGKEDIEYIKLCKTAHVSKEEIKTFINKVKFWSIVRGLQQRFQGGLERLKTTTGRESITEIISAAEKDIFDFIPDILNQEDLVSLPEYAKSYIEYLIENPIKIPGLPSGFPRWDKCLGGGLRRGTVNVIGGRPKRGKSSICLNIANNLIKQDIPVLYLDTELNKDIQTIRWTSLISNITQDLIETGQLGKDKDRVLQALDDYNKKPFQHINIAGQSPGQIISIMRRWLSQYVGRDENGKTKDCLVILDYLKTMDLEDMKGYQEYQYLGDTMTKLHNFAVQYDLPVIAAVQLNRDGIDKEDAGAVSGSDRIVWLCSSLTFIKYKTQEDYSGGDDKTNGDRKMIVVETRFGSGMDVSTEYINIKSNLACCQLTEGKYNYEILHEKNDLNLDEDANNEEDYIGDIYQEDKAKIAF